MTTDTKFFTGSLRGERLSTTRVLFAALRAIVRTRLNRRATLRLAEMPEYLLKDVGLRRDDIHEALNLDWREDPTYRLAMNASRRRCALGG